MRYCQYTLLTIWKEIMYFELVFHSPHFTWEVSIRYANWFQYQRCCRYTLFDICSLFWLILLPFHPQHSLSVFAWWPHQFLKYGIYTLLTPIDEYSFFRFSSTPFNIPWIFNLMTSAVPEILKVSPFHNLDPLCILFICSKCCESLMLIPIAISEILPIRNFENLIVYSAFWFSLKFLLPKCTSICDLILIAIP